MIMEISIFNGHLDSRNIVRAHPPGGATLRYQGLWKECESFMWDICFIHIRCLTPSGRTTILCKPTLAISSTCIHQLESSCTQWNRKDYTAGGGSSSHRIRWFHYFESGKPTISHQDNFMFHCVVGLGLITAGATAPLPRSSHVWTSHGLPIVMSQHPSFLWKSQATHPHDLVKKSAIHDIKKPQDSISNTSLLLETVGATYSSWCQMETEKWFFKIKTFEFVFLHRLATWNG